MKIQRTLSPAAAPISLHNVLHGILRMIRGKNERERFRNEIKSHFNVKYCFFVSSGKAALHCILKALHALYPNKDEVLIPAFNCYSVPSAIVHAGLKVRLCDVKPDTLDFDFDEFDRTIEDSDRLLCVIPTHMFGIPADVGRTIRSVGTRAVIVEDAAQAFGGSSNGKLLGLSGDVGFFSLGRGKAFSCVEGGIIVTDNDKIGKALAGIINSLPEYSLFRELHLLFNAIVLALFTHPLLFWLPKGLPFLGIGETVFDRSFPIRRLGAFQTGLTFGWAVKLKRLIADRSASARHWANFFNENPIPGIHPITGAVHKPVDLLRFPLRFSDPALRERILEMSEAQGLGIADTYPQSIDKLPELSDQVAGSYPNAALCVRTIATLPIHCYVTSKDRKRICGVFGRA